MAGSYACQRYGLIIWKICGIFMGKVGLSNNTMALLLYADSKNGSGMQVTQGIAS